MITRTPLQAIAQRPSLFLRSAWPWRSVAYLLSGGLFGAVLFLVLTALTLAGLVLVVTIIGVAVLLAVAFSGLLVGGLERRRLRMVDLEPVPDPHTPPDPTVPEGCRFPRLHRYRAWLLTRLKEPVTWRELAYTGMSVLVLCWIDLFVLAVAAYVPVQVATLGVFNEQAPWFWLCFSVPFGILLIPGSLYAVTAWAGARGALARAVLAPREDETGSRLVEVTRSRARLVDFFDLERRRIERDLHDGAQQRLTALIMRLGLIRLDVPDGPLGDSVDEALRQARLALDDTRELIRGVHPKVLSDRGLAAAVRDLVGRSPVPVDVDVDVPRLDPSVEVTAYFAISEALANIAKHSGATRARIHARNLFERLIVEIEDDGKGGADPTRGTGLTGLADRVSVHEGTLLISSPKGGPTLMRVELPCDLDPQK